VFAIRLAGESETKVAKHRKRRRGLCAYCGQMCEVTRDHVIPKCLFTMPLPKVMVTVPACDACHGKKSRHEDFLRDLLTMDIVGSESPVAQRLFHEKVLSSHRQGKSLVCRIAMAQARQTPIVTPAGVYVDECYVAHLDLDRVIEMFSFIVRGLYFRLRKVVLSPDCKFDVRRLGVEDAMKCWGGFEEYGYNGPYILGGGVFWCVCQYAASDDGITNWMLVFYERVYYGVVTTPPGFVSGPKGRDCGTEGNLKTLIHDGVMRDD